MYESHKDQPILRSLIANLILSNEKRAQSAEKRKAKPLRGHGAKSPEKKADQRAARQKIVTEYIASHNRIFVCDAADLFGITTQAATAALSVMEKSGAIKRIMLGKRLAWVLS